jgi:EAL domain-containing protein (putative c-di-GMP-specific phosphodiesterase class I)
MKKIPLHELKIDKSFVMTMLSDKQNEAIVRTTLELAHHMNLEVVAEGVEDEATLRYLSRIGCEQAQGYFLSKPIPSGDLIEWLSKRVDVSYEERRGGKRVFRREA